MKNILVIVLLLFTKSVSAQIVTQFIPEVNGRSVDALLQVKYLNTGQNIITGTLSIQVKEVRRGSVFFITVPNVNFNPGNNLLPHSLMNGLNIHFFENDLARLISQTNRLPEGEYEYCFSFSSQHAQINEECFDYVIEPVLPLVLLEPYHQSETCEVKPNFYWQPMMPVIPGTNYQLNLVELKTGQSPQEALAYNLPLIQQQGLNTPMLLFPPNAEALIEGKTYVWQVSAINNAMVLVRSEIWQFTVKCDPEKSIETPGSFRSIDDLSKGSFYIASPFLNFSIYNPYSTVELSYEIKAIKDAKSKIRNLPKVKLTAGMNKVQINLDDVKGMKSDEFYLLIVDFPRGQKKELRFVYHEQKY